MQPVEAFLDDYFRERTQMNRSWAALYAPLADRFLAPGYASWDTDAYIKNSDAEAILSTDVSGTSAQVITRGCFGPDCRARYWLSAVGESWQIRSIEMECVLCHGTGKRKNHEVNCPVCKGIGWSLMGTIKGT
jgi:hypothetical protein